MDDDTLWALIAESRQESGSDTELASRLLFRRLRKLDATEIVEFARLWERKRSRLTTWPVFDAACLLLDGAEEEDLEQIQDWIISYGRTAVERIIANPDSLADLAGDAANARAVWFGEFIAEAHIVISGTWPLDYDPDGPEELTGDGTDLSDRAAVEQRFPRLAAMARPGGG